MDYTRFKRQGHKGQYRKAQRILPELCLMTTIIVKMLKNSMTTNF